MTPEIAAEKVRSAFWGDRGFPVDPVTISRMLGVQVLETELPGDVSGALIKEAGKDPTIVIHYLDSNNRKRFSCAHELGHYISRIESNNIEPQYEYIDFRDSNSSNGNNPDEVFANGFAACLLMPENIVKQLCGSGKSHFEMALVFGVSNEAMKYRLKNLRLL